MCSQVRGNDMETEQVERGWKIRLLIMRANWQSRWWAIEHWLVMHMHRMGFCHSCSGYFRKACMPLPDKCEACYARDYGIQATYDPMSDRGA